MRVLSLFDGMSCGQIALNRIGIKPDKYYAAEIDKWAIQTTQKNYPDTIQLGDVTKVSFPEGEIDLLLAGSPCQGFSYAGKQLNFDDPRSALFWEFVRVLKESKPKYFLLENVRMKKEYQDIISEAVKCEPVEINSSLVSAQNRKRLYWTNIPKVSHLEDKGLVLSDILKQESQLKFNINKYSEKCRKQILKNSKTVKQKSIALCTNSNITGSGVTTIDLEDGVHYRKLTAIECERLQTVLDNYTEGVSNTQRYKMLGNGWTVDVIAHILRGMDER